MAKLHSGPTLNLPFNGSLSFLNAAMVLVLCAFVLLCAPQARAQDGTLSAPSSDILLAPTSPAAIEPESPVPTTQDTMNEPYDRKKLPDSLTSGDGPRRETADIKNINPEDIPQILLDEMKEIEQNCEGNYFYSSFHDCRCVAVRFLDERLKSDPETPQFIIFKRVNAQCPDKTAIAGFVYRSCYDMAKIDRPDYIDFCECVAKEMTEAYAKRPMVNMSYIQDLRKTAFRSCGSMQNNSYRVPQNLRQ
jgi:hypothetical protein